MIAIYGRSMIEGAPLGNKNASGPHTGRGSAIPISIMGKTTMMYKSALSKPKATTQSKTRSIPVNVAGKRAIPVSVGRNQTGWKGWKSGKPVVHPILIHINGKARILRASYSNERG